MRGTGEETGIETLLRRGADGWLLVVVAHLLLLLLLALSGVGWFLAAIGAVRGLRCWGLDARRVRWVL